jgi:hypothetical protein
MQELYNQTGDPQILKIFRKNPIAVDSWAEKNALHFSNLSPYE